MSLTVAPNPSGAARHLPALRAERNALSFPPPAQQGEVSPSSATEGSGALRHDPSVRSADNSPRFARGGSPASEKRWT